MNNLSHKIGEVKTYYNKYSDIGHTKLYRGKETGDAFEIKISETEGFPPASKEVDINILLIVFYVMDGGKLKFDHAVAKMTSSSGEKRAVKVETEEDVRETIRDAELDSFDTITINDDLNNYDLLTGN